MLPMSPNTWDIPKGFSKCFIWRGLVPDWLGCVYPRLTAGKPTVLLMMHHTNRGNQDVPQSRVLVNNPNVYLILDLLHHQGKLNKCYRNKMSTIEILKFIGDSYQVYARKVGVVYLHSVTSFFFHLKCCVTPFHYSSSFLNPFFPCLFLSFPTVSTNITKNIRYSSACSIRVCGVWYQMSNLLFLSFLVGLLSGRGRWSLSGWQSFLWWCSWSLQQYHHWQIKKTGHLAAVTKVSNSMKQYYWSKYYLNKQNKSVYRVCNCFNPGLRTRYHCYYCVFQKGWDVSKNCLVNVLLSLVVHW